ncbi:MAG: type II secretion system protein [Pirellulaceae bacterium]|nr:type II secretion system protein [Pirellulaceae bacterium]
MSTRMTSPTLTSTSLRSGTSSSRSLPPRRRITAIARPGLSLLEVILSLAILGVACTFMAQSMHLATNNALAAQRQAEAEIAAESVMSQVVAGLIPMQPTSTWTPIGISASTSDWSYILTSVNCEVENMIGIQIDVRDMSNQDTTERSDLSVIRWIIDPALGLDTPPTTDATGQTDPSGAAGQTGAAAGGLNGKM